MQRRSKWRNLVLQVGDRQFRQRHLGVSTGCILEGTRVCSCGHVPLVSGSMKQNECWKGGGTVWMLLLWLQPHGRVLQPNSTRVLEDSKSTTSLPSHRPSKEAKHIAPKPLVLDSPARVFASPGAASQGPHRGGQWPAGRCAAAGGRVQKAQGGVRCVCFLPEPAAFHGGRGVPEEHDLGSALRQKRWALPIAKCHDRRTCASL